MSLTSGVREAANAGECVICFGDNPDVSTLCCGNIVHLKCLKTWIYDLNNPSCTHCRAPLGTQGDFTSALSNPVPRDLFSLVGQVSARVLTAVSRRVYEGIVQINDDTSQHLTISNSHQEEQDTVVDDDDRSSSQAPSTSSHQNDQGMGHESVGLSLVSRNNLSHDEVQGDSDESVGSSPTFSSHQDLKQTSIDQSTDSTTFSIVVRDLGIVINDTNTNENVEVPHYNGALPWIVIDTGEGWFGFPNRPSQQSHVELPSTIPNTSDQQGNCS